MLGVQSITKSEVPSTAVQQLLTGVKSQDEGFEEGQKNLVG